MVYYACIQAFFTSYAVPTRAYAVGTRMAAAVYLTAAPA